MYLEPNADNNAQKVGMIRNNFPIYHNHPHQGHGCNYATHLLENRVVAAKKKQLRFGLLDIDNLEYRG
jgi:hypothetical protein